MTEAVPVPPSGAEGGVSLKDQGNEFFKSGNYLKAAALYTQAIKQDPSNPTLYSNRSAAFLHLVKLSKSLADAEKTITLKPQWEKGYFRKGCVLEAMERYDDAVAAFQAALEYNPQNAEVSRKIKRLTQLARDKKRAQEVETMRSNIDIRKHLDPMKPELTKHYGTEESCQDIFNFIVDVMETAIRTWHESGKLDARVNFLLDKQKTDTEKHAPIVNIDKAFESPHTHSNCFSFLRQYSVDSFSRAALLVTPKSSISYPQETAHSTSTKYIGHALTITCWCRHRLSTVRMAPRSAIGQKARTPKCALIFQMLAIGLCSTHCRTKKNEETEKQPSLLVV